MIDTNIMRDASEIVRYNMPGIPLYIRTSLLSEYTNMRALCHWHEDIEIIHILEGEMNYHINDKILLLKEQEWVVVNSRQLHYGCSHLGRDCKFVCVVFHPKLLRANASVYQKYVEPFLESGEITYLHYPAPTENPFPGEEWIRRLLSLKEEAGEGCELECVGTLYLLWRTLFLQCRPLLEREPGRDKSDLALQRKMVAYIYEHYQEPLTLEEIAASGAMSRSKCCTIFKRYLQQSPIGFLNKYRLEVARYLLANTRSGISQIAISCGFNHFSYFSKMFLREYGCTPTEYRRKQKRPGCLTAEA